jgi:hypothetical protein
MDHAMQFMVSAAMIMSAGWLRALSAVVGILAAVFVAAAAEPWPARSIALVVAFPPSTTPDFAALS